MASLCTKNNLKKRFQYQNIPCFKISEIRDHKIAEPILLYTGFLKLIFSAVAFYTRFRGVVSQDTPSKSEPLHGALWKNGRWTSSSVVSTAPASAF